MPTTASVSREPEKEESQISNKLGHFPLTFLVEQGHITVLSLPPMDLHLVVLESQEY